MIETAEDNIEVAKRRFDIARNLLYESEVNMQFEFWNSIINRLYYACFHAACGALATKGVLNVKTHEGTSRMLSATFVATGLISKDWGRFFNSLMQYRSSADYDIFKDFTRVDVEELYPVAKEFVDMLIERFYPE